MSRRLLLAPLAMIALALALTGCSSNSTPSGAGVPTGRVTVSLTDAPGNFEHVNLNVVQVAIHPADSVMVSGTTSGDSWVPVPASPGIFDLLELRNGVFTTLGTGQVPSGTYDQIRLMLGPSNSVVLNGTTYPLKVPSGLSSGYKLKGRVDVPTGGTVDVGIDFDAQRSVLQSGTGEWMLRPVARMVTIQLTGDIAGSVVPDTAFTSIYALQATDTVATTTTDANGHFVLAMLPVGTYSVHLVPRSPDFGAKSIDAVAVTARHVTDLGPVTLPPVVQPLAPVARSAPAGPAAARIRR